jgi:putative transposase
VKYAVITEYRDAYPVRLMCDALGVSASGYYAAQDRPPSARAHADHQLRLHVRAVHTASRGRYGAPQVHAALRAQAIRCGRKRVARLMRADGRRGACARRFRPRTTESGHRQPVAPNQLAREFSLTRQRERDRVWVADVTYLRTGEGWLYLAVVLDLASRRVIGWCADQGLGQALTVRALEQALALRQPTVPLLHHSDRGIHYAAAAYQAVLRAHGIQGSMSRVGNCWDNAVVESFFATLKRELAPARWPTRAAAQRELRDFIDVWYNQQRRHSTLGYQSPVAYERALAQLRRD